MATTLSRTNLNALVEDDGSFLTGTILDKATIEDVCLDPVDAAIAADIQFGGSIKERGRSVAMGEWQNEAYNGAHFAAVGGGTVTVASGDMLVNRYSLVGKTLYWRLRLTTFTTSGTVSSIRITLPGGLTCGSAGHTTFVSQAVTNGAPITTAVTFPNAGQTYVDVYTNGAGAGWAAGADNNDLHLSVHIEVQ